jgi:hypothetical protein
MAFEDEFLDNLRKALMENGENLIISDLKDARCVFIEKPYQDSDDRYTELHIHVPVDILFSFIPFEYHHDDILKYAQRIFPKTKPELRFIYSYPPYENSVNTLTNTSIQNTHSIFGEPSTEPQFQCDIFVIMPFSDEFETIYEHYITPCATELGLTVKIGKDPFSGKDIIHDIWSLLNNCQLVIADCTNRNPNVFYELGIAHTLDKRVIMITRDAKDLPFDVAGKRAIEYQYDPKGLPKLKSALKDAIQKILGMPI